MKYDLIHEEYKLRATNYKEMIRVYLYAMFIELSRVYVKNNHKSLAFSYDLVQLNRYEALVDKYYKKHRPISCYSKKMNITDRQLSYLCKKTVNKTPLSILTDRIILEAKRLLIHSNLSVSSIGNELNYNNDSYFIRFFKKNTKLTPEQFRNSQYES
jgi:AraC-like DNA-binding protein